MTRQRKDIILHGLGKYALEPRFVARRGKVPINPLNGYGAKANDPSTWGTLDQAILAMSIYEQDGIDGIGIELGNGLCGIDLDHCLDNGHISVMAKDIIEIMDSYTEISPSGTGIHILFSGEIPAGVQRKKDIEMYSKGRYFTVTGKLYELECR